MFQFILQTSSWTECAFALNSADRTTQKYYPGKGSRINVPNIFWIRKNINNPRTLTSKCVLSKIGNFPSQQDMGGKRPVTSFDVLFIQKIWEVRDPGSHSSDPWSWTHQDGQRCNSSALHKPQQKTQKNISSGSKKENRLQICNPKSSASVTFSEIGGCKVRTTKTLRFPTIAPKVILTSASFSTFQGSSKVLLSKPTKIQSKFIELLQLQNLKMWKCMYIIL